jgi:carbonic anhydrase
LKGFYLIKKIILSSTIVSLALASNWGYSGHHGPENWGDLDKSYKSCKSGLRQSPIDISKRYIANLSELESEYKDISLDNTNIKDNGHTIKVNYNVDDSFLIYEGAKYYLKQFHFHSPSEHTIDGVSYPLEIHLVHQAKDKSLSVIGIMAKEGNESMALNKIFHRIDDSKLKPETLNAKELMPKSLDYFAYNGSLTTPPCSENVNWIVLKEPIELSKEQIAHFNKYYKGNNRNIQTPNNRKVLEK